MVVQTKIRKLGVDTRQSVAGFRAITEALLHAEEWLHATEETIRAMDLREPVYVLNPVALRVRVMRVLGAHLQRRAPRQPVEVGAQRVETRVLKAACKGSAD